MPDDSVQTVPKISITVPWWQQGRKAGAGDLVAKVTTAAGVKPCGGCRKRRRALNRLIGFKGKK